MCPAQDLVRLPKSCPHCKRRFFVLNTSFLTKEKRVFILLTFTTLIVSSVSDQALAIHLEPVEEKKVVTENDFEERLAQIRRSNGRARSEAPARKVGDTWRVFRRHGADICRGCGG